MVRLAKVARIPRLPERGRAAHKGDFGTLGVLAGSETMLGAAILCARAGLRGGAGWVRGVLPRRLLVPFLCAVPAATGVVRGAVAGVAFDALVIGPGLGQSTQTRRLVAGCLRQRRCPMVIDADALNVLAPLRRPLRSRGPCVLTPHPGEAARLLGSSPERVQADRRAAVSELCTRSGHVVVLKGAGTLVCDGRRMFTNSTGNPGLATAGSGDVLAGLLGALLAQGVEPFAAACLAVHVHGAAGDLVAKRLSEPGLCAEDLPLAIAEVLGS